MHRTTVTALALCAGLLAGAAPAPAQPAKGAPASYQRVLEVMRDRWAALKLTGDPDRDFAAMLAVEQDNLVFLAKTQLDFGWDRELRELAQALADDAAKRIALLKTWEVRRAQASYVAQPDQPPPGSGPLDRGAAVPTDPAPAPPASVAQAAPAAKALPFVRGTIDDLDASSGKITIEHEAIPNLGMDAMTMVFRAADPAMVKAVKKGQRVRFNADRVNGQLTVTKIEGM